MVFQGENLRPNSIKFGSAEVLLESEEILLDVDLSFIFSDFDHSVEDEFGFDVEVSGEDGCGLLAGSVKDFCVGLDRTG